jgi:hypothetical protein
MLPNARVTELLVMNPACRCAYAVGQVPSLADPGLAPPTPWWQRLRLLEDFMALRGRPPRSGRGSLAAPLTKEERELGEWCKTQRNRRKGRKHYAALGPAQQAALEAVSGWQWEPWAEEWKQRLHEVEAFEQHHGRLPRRQGSKAQPLVEGERVLGHWCSNQRQRRKGHGKYAALSPEQAAKLEAIPVWQWDPLVEDWEQRLQEVAAFGRRHGRLPRSSGGTLAAPLTREEQGLGVWCNKQRQRRKGHGRSAALAPEQAAKLEAILCWRW